MHDLISNLGIDWKLIIAQIVNFTILAIVLTKFVYKPILKTLENRKKNIIQTESLKKDLHLKLEEAENTKNEILKDARVKSNLIIEESEKNAIRLKEDLINTAKKEAEKIEQIAKKEISEEKEKTIIEIKREIGEVMSLAISKSFGDVLDKSAQNKLLAEALEKTSEK